MTQPVSTGLAVIELARAGRFADIRELFAPQLRGLVAADALKAAWTAELDRQGPVATVGEPVSEPTGTDTFLVRIPVTLEHGGMALLVAVNGEGQLGGLQIAPAEAAAPIAPWEPPSYAAPEAFDEQDVTIGTGPLAVSGTLSVPHRQGPVPAVVLLVGSGPNDRDETIGRNKPFKDLAWGLASGGVAVLRFDKVSYAHPDDVVRNRDFTVFDEYVPHAVAAVQLLQQHPAVDAERVFVLGHSQGGSVAPRIAQTEPSVAGLVIMAGGTQPMHWAAVRQFRYIAALDPATEASAQPTIDAISKQAAMVDSPHLSPSTPDSELPFGAPARYWLDLRDYHPVATAAALHRPMLILQGGRDYQATVADDLVRWQAGLADHPDVTIRVYDADNHLFFPGTGPSSPAEYEPAQHVDPAVVADIAAWLTSQV